MDAPSLPVRSQVSTANHQDQSGFQNTVSDSETDSDEGEKEVEEKIIGYEKSMTKENKKIKEVWGNEDKVGDGDEDSDRERKESDSTIHDLKGDENTAETVTEKLKIRKFVLESPVQGPWKSSNLLSNSVNSSSELVTATYANNHSLLSERRHSSLPQPLLPTLSQSLLSSSATLLSNSSNIFEASLIESVQEAELNFYDKKISPKNEIEVDDFDEFSQFLDKSKNDNDDGKVDENDDDQKQMKVKENDRDINEESKEKDERDGVGKAETSEGKERKSEELIDGMTECLVMLQKKLKQLQKRLFRISLFNYFVLFAFTYFAIICLIVRFIHLFICLFIYFHPLLIFLSISLFLSLLLHLSSLPPFDLFSYHLSFLLPSFYSPFLFHLPFVLSSQLFLLSTILLLASMPHIMTSSNRPLAPSSKLRYRTRCTTTT